MLRWLDDPATFTANAEGERWDAFCSAFQERFGLSVDAGAVTVAQQLGLQQTDAWTKVWRRFAESPSGYPNIPDRLRAARPKRVAENRGCSMQSAHGHRKTARQRMSSAPPWSKPPR